MSAVEDMSPDETAETVAPPRGRHTVMVIAGIVGILVLVLVGLFATRDTGERAATSELLDKPVPPVTGTDLGGNGYDIGDHQGEWVLVNFFSTWCAPCVQEHPQLVAFDKEHREKGDGSVVSVVFDDDTDAVRDFFEREGGDWPVLVEGTDGVAVSFGVTGVPESYLVAPDGTVVAKWISGVTASDIDGVITELTTGSLPPS